MMIERTFQNIPEGDLTHADQQSFLISLGWSKGQTWESLLQSKRVLIISEAGAGKTHECRKQAKRLWDAGEPAFLVELATLASEDLSNVLDDQEEARLEAWRLSQSDVATFFLDSIDELKLSQNSFESALKRLKKGIGNHLSRVRIIITTRPIPFDQQLVRTLLPIPIPPALPTQSGEEAFAKAAMRDTYNKQENDKEEDANADWQTVALMPLSDVQIVEFARLQDIDNPMALLEDLQKRNAQKFARRPQDLIELCADWREHKRIRTHRDQVEANVRIKLLPRTDRREPAELSLDKAIAGASRLALAMLVTRRLTIRHNAASDTTTEGDAALNPEKILSDWKPNERKALLERPLFGFASYGRVRFHHQSVVEYLAAERLLILHNRGMPFRALVRLLFAETKSKTIVRPSKRAIAGWLALADTNVFEMLRNHEPAVLLNEGDPESLTPTQRNQALRAYVMRYGQGGWRGLTVPQIQIHRFASPELANEIIQLWKTGIENPDVRNTLLWLIETGRINECADITHNVTYDSNTSIMERINALDAMIALEDSRLKNIAHTLVSGDGIWPDEFVHAAILRMFPRYLSVDLLCQVLSRVNLKNRSVGDLSWQLKNLFAEAELDSQNLIALRDGLVELVSTGINWHQESQKITSDHQHFSDALAATCIRGLAANKSNIEWLHASILAVRLHDHNHDYSFNDEDKALKGILTSLNAEENCLLFWAEDSLLKSVHTIDDPWERFTEITTMFRGSATTLRTERDLEWIKSALADTARETQDRAMLLEAAISLSPSGEQWRDHVSKLKPLVTDQPELLNTINERLRPSKPNKTLEMWAKRDAEQKKQHERRHAKNYASWIQFWREISQNPELSFSSERSRNTAWDLWRVMSHNGKYSQASGWNRRFIEEQFDKATADKLRHTMMNIWRQDHPTLTSERPENERNTYLAQWQLGLAGLPRLN